MKQIETPDLATHPKDVDREKIAQDIRNYLNRGGTIKRIHHGETGSNDHLSRVWSKKILHSEKPKKR